jgi:16S rRNA (cytosine967-C5)-methyltransferase
LLYATCSVFAQENQALVDAFLARAPYARAETLPAGVRNQWLPGPRHDGFFYALIQKTA